jgi:hypothetical protein
MGHYASEMDPGWSASIERSTRHRAIKEAVNDMPLSAFRGRHFSALKRLYSYDELLPNHEKVLNEVIESYKKNGVTVNLLTEEDYGPGA